ncbi:hypothetical protein N9L68_01015 [bacterium]|nr:hypothetical protein [bacterium]
MPQADYKLSGNTASYVVDRSESTFFSNVTEAGPSSVRVVTWNVNSDNFIDLNSLHFSFEVVNTDTTNELDFLSYLPQVLFDRMLIQVGGVSVETLDYFNRVSVLFDTFLPSDKRQNNADLGFGTPPRTNDKIHWQALPIPAGGSRRVVFKPLISGLISGHNKYMLGWALGSQGLQLQLQLAQANDVVDTGTNKSNSYVLRDLRVNCNTIMVDSGLMNSYSQHLLSGRSFFLSFVGQSTMMHALPGTTDTWDVNINRTFTRLVDVYSHWMNNPTHTEKDVNTFYSPVTASGANTIKTHVSMGDKRFSTFDRNGSAELLQRLYETLGTSNSFQGVQFDRAAFDAWNFCLAYDCEKVSQATGSGMNLSHGQLLKIHVQGAGNATSNYVQKAYTTCRYDVILELTSTGASVHS